MRHLFFFTLLFSIYLCGASIDLTITVQAAKLLSGSDGLATIPYALMGLGTMLSARYGIYPLTRLPLPRVFFLSSLIAVVSGLLSALAVVTQHFLLLCLSIFLIGVYCGFSNYYRILVVNYVPQSLQERATAICMSGGVIAACIGPVLAIWLSQGGAAYENAYAFVVFLGIIAAIASLALPQGIYSPAEKRAQSAVSTEKNSTKTELTAASVIAFISYVVMTLVMTAGPLQAITLKVSDFLFSASVQSHMIGMYLPMLVVAYLIKKSGADVINQIGLFFGAVTLAVSAFLPPPALLFFGMLFAGLFWALVYSGASTLMALNLYGQNNPAARGKSELFPPIGMMTGASLAGVAFHILGFQTLVLLSAIILLIAFFANRIFLKRSRRAV